MISKAVFIFIISTPSICYSYDQFEVGKASGMYIAASDILFKLKQSECGYIIKRPVRNIDEAKKEVFEFLDESDREAFKKYFNSTEFKLKIQKNNQLVNQAISTVKSSTDTKTGCGLAVGSLLNVIKTGEDAWAKQINKH